MIDAIVILIAVMLVIIFTFYKGFKNLQDMWDGDL